MTKVSRKPLSAGELKEIENQFWNAISKLKSPSEIKLFFLDLLTHTERKMLSKRLQIARMLLREESYMAIRKRLHVTDITIAKINNWLNSFGDGYRLAVEKLEKE
ncbi:MAG: TrpR-like protein YerC/YecD [Candidatus Doudnabacteria bacterium]|nr:TrpR-like protein YerC/YecD [Candidatus Doudnabacteria bacterium]